MWISQRNQGELFHPRVWLGVGAESTRSHQSCLAGKPATRSSTSLCPGYTPTPSTTRVSCLPPQAVSLSSQMSLVHSFVTHT